MDSSYAIYDAQKKSKLVAILLTAAWAGAGHCYAGDQKQGAWLMASIPMSIFFSLVFRYPLFLFVWPIAALYAWSSVWSIVTKANLELARSCSKTA